MPPVWSIWANVSGRLPAISETNAALPKAHTWVSPSNSICALTPCPIRLTRCCTFTSSADTGPSESVWFKMARAMGCSDCCSNAWAMARAWASFRRPALNIRLTESCPLVSVPVLSNTTSPIWASVSRLCLPLMRMPSLASAPVEAASAVGVASDKAHGQVMTSRATVIHKAVCASAYQAQPIKTGMASKSSPNTKLDAYFSANSAARGFCASARSSSLTIWDRRVLPPVWSVRMIKGLLVLSVPAVTFSDGLFTMGRLSPVNMASLTSLSPDKTVPSTGMTSPGFTTIVSPILRRTTAASSMASLSG